MHDRFRTENCGFSEILWNSSVLIGSQLIDWLGLRGESVLFSVDPRIVCLRTRFFGNETAIK